MLRNKVVAEGKIERERDKTLVFEHTSKSYSVLQPHSKGSTVQLALSSTDEEISIGIYHTHPLYCC